MSIGVLVEGGGLRKDNEYRAALNAGENTATFASAGTAWLFFEIPVLCTSKWHPVARSPRRCYHPVPSSKRIPQLSFEFNDVCTCFSGHGRTAGPSRLKEGFHGGVTNHSERTTASARPKENGRSERIACTVSVRPGE
ncbi:hypothetical protein Hypma_009932 [Hypsizygus marmoreus]|uniref:Uncharacterized protein n=1 Tax=Hypsizygus marmoreus TaxID=39966 RepID=A0A369JRW8_HYPMA|nr:hypothetical protein Hypma_009932 [Hypsizygus marmoreus]